MNACRHAERYFPYLSTDSVGGDTHYESYKVSGGYAFPLVRWVLGVQGAFDGELAHRLTDPRFLTIDTWLKAGVGASCDLHGQFSCLKFSYLRTIKKVSVGFDTRCFMGRGERDKNVSYQQEIGFESSAPVIQTEPDKHDFCWGQTSLLVEF